MITSAPAFHPNPSSSLYIHYRHEQKSDLDELDNHPHRHQQQFLLSVVFFLLQSWSS